MNDMQDSPSPSSAIPYDSQLPVKRMRLLGLLLQSHWSIFSFTVLTIVVAIGGSTICILSILGILQTAWSNIVGVVFTAFGIVLALCQYCLQVTPMKDELPRHTSAPLHTVSAKESPSPLITKKRGALRVKVRKPLRGTTLILYKGFNESNQQPEVAANITEYIFSHQRYYIGVFPLLEPGNYTVSTATRERVAQVTIVAGHIAEIDWR